MTRLWLRRLALGVLGLVILLGAVVTWFVAGFDAERYKALAIDWMKREHDRTLVVAGPVKLSVFPRIELQLGGLALSEPARPGDEFAAVDEIALAVRLAPLFAGRVVVDRVAARGVRAAFVRDAKGRRNIDDLLGATPARPDDRANDTTGARGGRVLAFDIAGIELEDVRARVRDAIVPLAGEVTLAKLETGRLAPGVAAPVELDARLALAQPSVQGRLEGRTQVTLDLVSGAATLERTRLTFKGDVPGARAVDARLEAGQLERAGDALAASDVHLTLGARVGTIELANSRLDLGHFAWDAAKQSLRLDKLAAEVAGRDGKEPVAFALDWPRIEAQGRAIDGSGFSGHVALAGANALDARLQSGAPTGSFERLRLPGFTVDFKARLGARQVEGQVKSELSIEPARRAAVFDKLAVQAGVREAGGAAPLSLKAGGAASASPQAASARLAGSLNDNAFDAEGGAQFAAEGKGRTKVQAEARFDRLDLNALLPPAAAASGAAPRAASDAPLDLSALNAADGHVALRAGQLIVRQYKASDVRLEATLDKGVLRVGTLQAKAWGGALDASAFAEAATNRLGVKFAGSGVNVNALLRDVAGYDRLEGTGRVSADVQGRGRSVAELRRSLDGTAALQLRDGAVRGVNLAKALRQAKAALTQRRDAVQRSSSIEKTDFSELKASLRIADGVAHNDDLDLKSPFLRVGGAGTIDIGRGRIDYLARASVTAAPTGQDGADLALLKGLTVPVRLEGPFEAVDWHIQWSAVAAGALKNQLRERLGEALGTRPGGASAPAPRKPEDALKDRLKGLFGR